MQTYTYFPLENDQFVVTGVYYNSNRKFKSIHTSNFRHAMGINLWKGNVWLIRDNKKKLIKKVY